MIHIPFTGRNNNEFDIFRGNHILVLNKADLAPPPRKAIFEALASRGDSRVVFMSSNARSAKDKNTMIDVASQRPLFDPVGGARALIIGMPNVGKSSLINSLRNVHMNKAKCAPTGDRPGVTRSVQTHIKINEDPPFFIYDTPGVMIPRIDRDETAMKLAVVGTLRDELVGEEYIADYILFTLNRRRAFGYVERYQLKDGPSDDIDHLLTSIAVRSGAVLKQGKPNLLVAAQRFIRDFRQGALGRMWLESDAVMDRMLATGASASNPNASEDGPLGVAGSGPAG